MTSTLHLRNPSLVALAALAAGAFTVAAGSIAAAAADCSAASTTCPTQTGTTSDHGKSGWSNGTGEQESPDVVGSQGGSRTLPFTGTSTGLLGGLGLTALAAGGALVLAGRERRPPAATVPRPRMSSDDYGR